MKRIITEWLDEIVGILSFLALVGLLGYAVHKGALKDEPLALVLIVLALLTPSPTKLLIKWRDFVAQRRKNNGQTENPSKPSEILPELTEPDTPQSHSDQA